MISPPIRIRIFIVLVSGLLSSQVAAAPFAVSLADREWNGSDVPEGQQCQRFGGDNPQSPVLQVTNIPDNADALVLEFSDRDVAPMDKGGHGKIAYPLNSETEIMIPSVPGHMDKLPAPFFVVEMHRAPRWDVAGAYLPPCSGGRGNNYFIDVKAVTLGEEQEIDEVLASASVKMATY